MVEPLFVVVTAVATVLSPLLLAVAVVASPFVSGRWRPLRATAFTIVWMHLEVVAIAVCAWIWLTSIGRIDEPRTVRRHYRLMRWFLRRACRSGVHLLNVRVSIEDDGVADAVLRAGDRPLLMFSRHSGPGDTFYLLDLLLDDYGREPRIVMKEMLKLDPCIDLLGSRTPSYFVPPPMRRRKGAWAKAIGALAAGLDRRGVLLLFPEGGNFSEERRRRRLVRLLRGGRRRDAERAVRMHHVVAPEPGGALTAVRAAPGASVILVAHSGLAGLEGGKLLARAPMDQVFRVHLWYIDAAGIPRDDEPQRQWLLDCWQRIDDWVAADHEAQISMATTSGPGPALHSSR